MRTLLAYAKAPFSDLDSKRSTHGDSLYVLDGVRGLAVLVVMSSHTSAFGMAGQGSLGVLLFFFLSGFLLTLPYAGNPRQLFGGGELYRFAASRVLRVVPIYLIAVALIAWLLGADLNWFFANAFFLKGWNHLWSVAEEARFYVLFPLVILSLALLPGWLSRVVFLAGVTWLAREYLSQHRIDMLDGRHVDFYFWMFMGGCLACFLYKWPALHRRVDRKLGRFLFGTISALTIVLIFLTSNQLIDQLWRPLIPSLPEDLVLNGWRIPGVWFFLFLCLLYGLSMFPDTLAGRFLQSRFLRHIGLLSFSLYLFHVPVIQQLNKYGFRQESLFLIAFAITYAIAFLSYLVVEKPFLLLKPKKRDYLAGKAPAVPLPQKT